MLSVALDHAGTEILRGHQGEVLDLVQVGPLALAAISHGIFVIGDMNIGRATCHGVALVVQDAAHHLALVRADARVKQKEQIAGMQRCLHGIPCLHNAANHVLEVLDIARSDPGMRCCSGLSNVGGVNEDPNPTAILASGGSCRRARNHGHEFLFLVNEHMQRHVGLHEDPGLVLETLQSHELVIVQVLEASAPGELL